MGKSLEDLTKIELQQRCRDKQIKGYSYMNKKQLVKVCREGHRGDKYHISRKSGRVTRMSKTQKMTVVELRKKCKNLGVKGYSSMKKDQLANACRLANKNKDYRKKVGRPKKGKK